MIGVPDPQSRPIDRNPSVACHQCGESHNYRDYWQERYVEGYSWNPAEMYWLCDVCLDEMYEWYENRRREREHKTLTEWSE